MLRRDFIALIGGATVGLPLAPRAQQREQMRRIGMLLPAAADDAVFQTWVGAFLQGLAVLGWTIGRNVRIETRWATTNAPEIRRNAAELAALAPDVILAHGASTSDRCCRRPARCRSCSRSPAIPDLILRSCHAAAAAASRVQRNSVPSTQMRCMITASRRASATIAFFIPRRLAICIAQALSQDHFLERIML